MPDKFLSLDLTDAAQRRAQDKRKVPGSPASSQEQGSGALGSSRKRARSVSQLALNSETAAIAKARKIGFNGSRGTEVTEVSPKHKAPASRYRKGDKSVERQLQRKYFARNFRPARKDAGLS